jgi:hypothetical protein
MVLHDHESALQLFQRAIGSPLAGLGELHRSRRDFQAAREAWEQTRSHPDRRECAPGLPGARNGR